MLVAWQSSSTALIDCRRISKLTTPGPPRISAGVHLYNWAALSIRRCVYGDFAFSICDSSGRDIRSSRAASACEKLLLRRHSRKNVFCNWTFGFAMGATHTSAYHDTLSWLTSLKARIIQGVFVAGATAARPSDVRCWQNLKTNIRELLFDRFLMFNDINKS